MSELLNLPEPLKPHSPEECRVCGEELPFSGAKLCDQCWAALCEMERKRWLGPEGPTAVFLGIAFRKLSVGIALTGETASDNAFPIIPPQQKRMHWEWAWNPDTKKMEFVEDPPEHVCWLFWKDRDDEQVKSKVFWGMGEALDYMSFLQDQGHLVTKAGLKIFTLRGGV